MSLRILRDYVDSFEPVERSPRISRYISCKMLMDCDSPEEVKILLGKFAIDELLAMHLYLYRF